MIKTGVAAVRSICRSWAVGAVGGDEGDVDDDDDVEEVGPAAVDPRTTESLVPRRTRWPGSLGVEPPPEMGVEPGTLCRGGGATRVCFGEVEEEAPEEEEGLERLTPSTEEAEEGL